MTAIAWPGEAQWSRCHRAATSVRVSRSAPQIAIGRTRVVASTASSIATGTRFFEKIGTAVAHSRLPRRMMYRNIGDTEVGGPSRAR
jgi:hypothetical protein